MFPVLMSPRGRIFGGEDGALGPVVRSARRSDFLLGDTGIDDGGSMAGTEKPTTDEIGRALGALDADASAGDRRSDAHDLGGCFATVGNTAGGSVRLAGATICSLGGATVSTFGDSGDDLPLLGEAAAIDNEVFVDRGDSGMGVSGAVEHAGVVSVADEEGTSACSGEVRVDTFNSPPPSSSWGNSVFREGGGEGEGGGVGRSIAFCMTSCGGRARGDIMIPGASEGSCGLRDQIAHPPLTLSTVDRVVVFRGEDKREDEDGGLCAFGIVPT
jgi:hypothetical protein